MKRQSLLVLLGGLMLTQPAVAQGGGGDPQNGRKVANMCKTCHGINGVARIPIAPHIGGETEAYITRQLAAFKSGEREHEMMTVVAKSLQDKAIRDVAAWYASMKVTVSIPAEKVVEEPEVCISCHGTNGLSELDEAPHLAGESTIYIETQLKAFRNGKRKHDIMTAIAEEMTDDEIRSSARWFSNLSFVAEAP